VNIEAGPEEEAFEDERERVDRPMARLFAEYGRDHAGYFAVGLVSSVLSRLLDLLPPLLLAVAIDAIFNPEMGFRLWLVPEAWLPTDRTAQLWFTGGLIAAAFLFAAAFHYARNWGWNRFAQGVQHRIRTDTYDKMQHLNMDYFTDKQTGELMSVLSNDVNRLERFLNDGINSASRLIVMVFGIAAILLALNWQLALVALLPVPLIAIFTRKFIEIIQPKYAAVRSSVGTLNSRLENNLGGIQVIKTSTTEPYESDRVEDVSEEYYDANWDAIRTRITFFPGLRLLSNSTGRVPRRSRKDGSPTPRVRRETRNHQAGGRKGRSQQLDAELVRGHPVVPFGGADGLRTRGQNQITGRRLQRNRRPGGTGSASGFW